MAKLTPEELHLKRSEAAKRAAQTLKKREAQDAEFHARMQAIRLANLSKGRITQQKLRERNPEEYRRRASERAKKAAETVRKRRAQDAEYNLRYLESHRKATERIKEINRQRAESKRQEEERIRQENEELYDRLRQEHALEELRRQREEREEELRELERKQKELEEEIRKREEEQKEEPEEQDSYDSLFDYTEEQEEEQEEFDSEAYEEARQEYGDEADVRDYLPTEAGSIINTLQSILAAAVNVNTAHYLLDLMEDEINNMDGETREEQEVNFAERIKNSSDELITAATDVAFEPSDQDKLYNNAVFFADLIAGGNNQGFVDQSIREMASLDIPFNNSKSKRYYHV